MAAFLRVGRCASALLNLYKPIPFRLSNHAKTTLRINNYRLNDTFKRCLSVQSPQPLKDNFQSQRLDKALSRLDSNVRRTGRISKKEVEDIFSEIKSTGTATSTQSLLVIRCCGSVLPDELPEVRNALVKNIWNTLQSLEIPFDVSHYNALLKVYIENEYKFSPTSFLEEMEKKGVLPNRVTYQHLITHYCQMGDISGASKILEFMKEKELPVNEKVFNVLIMGHARSNDMESAQGIIEMMKNAKLEPSADTYTTLICAFAEKGDIKSIHQSILDAEKDNVTLMDQNFLEIIYTLAKHGHSKYVDEVLGKLRKFTGYNYDASISVLKLININEDELAYKILKTMNRLTIADKETLSSGGFFIRQLVKLERPVEKILEFCEDMKNNNINNFGLLKATETALQLQKTDLAVNLFRILKEQGMPIRQHYFWPVLVSLKQEGNESKIYEIVQLMSDMEVPANYNTFVEYVFPALTIVDVDEVIEKFKGTGHTLGAVASPLVEHFLNLKQINKAAKLVESHFIKLSPGNVTRPLLHSYIESQDISSLKTILTRLKESSDDQSFKIDWLGQFLQELISVSGVSSQLEDILIFLGEGGFVISPASVETICKQAPADIPENIISLIEKLSSASAFELVVEDDQNGIPHPNEMNLEELESHLIELKSKNMNVRGVLRRLLILHCKSKNFDKAMEIKRQMDEEQFVYSGAVLAQLLDLHVFHQKLDESLDFLNQLQTAYPDFVLDDHKILNLAALLAQTERVQEAIKLIESHQAKHGVRETNLQFNTWKLLNATAEKGDPENTKTLLNLVMNPGYCQPTNAILGSVVKAHLMKNDIEGALIEFEHCCKKYKFTPWRNELFLRLINKEDTVNLQKAMDLNTGIHGEMNALYDLGFSFLAAERFREARKIFETPGIRAIPKRLEAFCQRFLDANQIVQLEQLVAITKDLFDSNRDQLYYFLLKAYCKEENVQKALNVWVCMQEENVQPSDQTLLYLADFLKKHNHEVPFIIPERSKVLTTENKLIESLQVRDVDAALQFKEKIENSGSQLTVQDISKIISTLLEKERLNEAIKISFETLENDRFPFPKVLKALFHKLSETGDVETMKSFDSKLSRNVKNKSNYNNLLAICYINSGRHLELLENLEKDVEESKEFCPSGGLLGLMLKYPEFEDRIETLAKEYVKHQFHGLMHVMWNLNFIKKNYEKAEQLYQKYLQDDNRFNFRAILKQARNTKDESLVVKLIEVSKSRGTTSLTLRFMYSTLIDIQLMNKNLDGAVKSVQNAKMEDIEELHSTSLRQLQMMLEAEGKPVPFTISKNAQSSSSSSSDSDSESDNEKKEQKQRK